MEKTIKKVNDYEDPILKDRPETCCKELLKLIVDYESPVTFHNKFREYSLLCIPYAYHDLDLDNDGVYLINNCPKCGSVFLPELRSEWYSSILEEFGVRDIYESGERLKIPEYFFSSRWWKNRKFEKKAELAEKSDSFCCKSLEVACFSGCQDQSSDLCTDLPLIFDEKSKSFFLTSTNSAYKLHDIYKAQNRLVRSVFYKIYFCPWCGAKLPKSLAKEWLEAVSKKFGVTDVSNHRAVRNLPKKYLSDQWWKEAGM